MLCASVFVLFSGALVLAEPHHNQFWKDGQQYPMVQPGVVMNPFGDQQVHQQQAYQVQHEMHDKSYYVQPQVVKPTQTQSKRKSISLSQGTANAQAKAQNELYRGSQAIPLSSAFDRESIDCVIFKASGGQGETLYDNTERTFSARCGKTFCPSIESLSVQIELSSGDLSELKLSINDDSVNILDAVNLFDFGELCNKAQTLDVNVTTNPYLTTLADASRQACYGNQGYSSYSSGGDYHKGYPSTYVTSPPAYGTSGGDDNSLDVMFKDQRICQRFYITLQHKDGHPSSYREVAQVKSLSLHFNVYY